MELLLLLTFVPWVSELHGPLEKIGNDLFKNLKHQSLEFITPSNSKTFFMSNTKSTFSWISETNVYI